MITGCNYRSVQKSAQSLNTQQDINVLELSNNYESVRQLVIQNQCLTCHSEAGGNKGKLNLESYTAVKQNLNQIMYRVLEKRDMPEGGLPEAEYELIKLWIESGAPEKNTGNGANQPILGPLDWEKIKTQILVQNCLDCHNAGSTDSKLDLTSIDNFKANLPAIVDRVFVKQDMPPEPYSSMTVNQRQALLKWISQGFPQ